MTYTINKDCHVILYHPDVNGGVPCGFVLQSQNKQLGPAVSIQKEVTSQGVTNVKVFFNVLLADDLVNPDGSKHAATRAQMYALLSSFLAQSADVQLTTSVGLINNIGATGHSATETHYGPVSVVACQMNNKGIYNGPVDPVALNGSVWDGTLTWASSYWR